MSGSLAGVRALVTGGSRGIGRAIVLALADEGAHVVFGYHGDREQAERTRNELRARDSGAAAIEADLSREDECSALVTGAVDELGGLDVVVNNAGILHEQPLLDTDVADFDRVIGVNLRGTFLVGRESIRWMVQQGSGGQIGRAHV